MDCFLSCDWGTSTLRLKLVDTHTGAIIAEESNAQGIAYTYNLWQTLGEADENTKTLFYLNMLQQLIQNMETRLNRSLNGIRLIISGMASSSIGFLELPYSELPFSLSGADLQLGHLPAQAGFDHPVTVVSGIKSDDDVIRGEETQLLGYADVSTGPINHETFVFPGTHSKHIHVNGNKVSGFKTYMTGDFFELLSQKSILSNAVEEDDDMETDHSDIFKQGVADSINANLLNAAFKVRTNNLFGVYNKKQNFNYLSGLLIGTELKELLNSQAQKIHLICGAVLQRYYRMAFEHLGMLGKVEVYAPQRVEYAVVRAHYKIYNQIEQ